MATKHDELMKRLLASFPDQFLRIAAPEIAERVDLGSVVFEPEEHYPGSPTGRARRADLAARASALPETAEEEITEVVLHAEIELRYRSRTEGRLLGYHRGLSLKYGLTVHTIVLYLRGGPPGAQIRVYEERSLGQTVVTFRYHSLGLSRAPAAEYLARPEPLAWALAALMRPAAGQGRPQLGLACVRRIAQARELTQDERELLFECVMRYAKLQDPEATAFDMILHDTDNEGVRDMTTTMVEWWEKQGREKGRAEGQRDLVLHLLKERFGRLSSEVHRQVSAIESADELTRLATRALQVQTLDELGLA
jgi:Domain of unknown function (DUF4351)